MGVLSPEQLQNGRTIYGLALKAGLPAQRAQELVYAAYRESGLKNSADNAQTHAAGLFQLLSPGYRQRAQALGGLADPVANTEAILPDYVSFFRSHPGAAPGAGAAAVERSGKGAGFYAPDGSLVDAAWGTPGMGKPKGGPPPVGLLGDGKPSRALPPLAKYALDSLQASFNHNEPAPSISDLIGAQMAQRQGSTSDASSGPLPAPGTPAGYKGNGVAPAPGKLDSRLVALSHQYGLVITSGYRDPAHNAAVGGAQDSYHTHGEAIDVSPTANALKFAAQAHASPGNFTELFGPFPWYIKDGVIHPGQFPGHSDHVHIVLSGSV